MFGYVSPEKPELKIREFETFRGYYCAVCKGIGRHSGQLPRFTLSYDLAFLALLLDTLSGEKTVGKLERCIAHPVKKHYVVAETPATAYASDMNVLLAYYHLKDKWQDDRSIPAATGAAFMKRAVKRVGKKWPEQEKIVKESIAALTQLENSGCDAIDEVAERFGELMSSIFACPLIASDDDRKVLGWLGTLIGRWIYMIDAVDDLEKDMKSGSYNPVLKQFKWAGEATADFRKTIQEPMDFMLMMTLSEIEKAFELLTPQKHHGILDNIFQLGLTGKTDRIMKRGCTEHGSESV